MLDSTHMRPAAIHQWHCPVVSNHRARQQIERVEVPKITSLRLLLGTAARGTSSGCRVRLLYKTANAASGGPTGGMRLFRVPVPSRPHSVSQFWQVRGARWQVAQPGHSELAHTSRPGGARAGWLSTCQAARVRLRPRGLLRALALSSAAARPRPQARSLRPGGRPSWHLAKKLEPGGV